jgi:hypothetical protein
MKFRNHFTNEGTTRKDWSKTWQNWVIRTAETLGRSPIAPGQKGKPTIFDTHVFLREDSAEFKAWKDYRSVRGLGLAPCSDPSDKTKQGSWFPTKMPPDEEFVRVGTPRFEAWESHLKSRNVRLVIVDHPLDGTKGTYVPLDWSPSPQAKAA